MRLEIKKTVKKQCVCICVQLISVKMRWSPSSPAIPGHVWVSPVRAWY